jgi:KDO2-lipid IV(A) lauroyltransferase
MFSDLLYLLMHHIVRYRKKVVYGNIAKAFPGYTRKEIRHTARKFYHHLCDLILESAVSYFYSESEALEKFSYVNPEVLDEMYAKGKQVLAVAGHYGNWEYLNTLAAASAYPTLAIYKPLKNKYFDGMMKKIRNKYGCMLVPMEMIARSLITHSRDRNPVMTIILSDQRPMFHQIHYWTKFLGIDTPMYMGTEKLARKVDAAVLFFKIRKVKRGRYEVDIEVICENPGSMGNHQITDAHVRVLENLIREEPGYWLWSHRRWRHSIEKYQQEHAEKEVPGNQEP